jgi:hypothetical protein
VTTALRRAMIAAMAVTAAMAAAPIVAAPMVAQAAPAATAVSRPPNPLADPTANATPSRHFVDACRSMGVTKAANDKCDAAALRDFDVVRRTEGLGPLILPSDFDTLSVPAQLLAISNLERVDRGRRPVLGLSTALDKLATRGAKADTDPPFPNPYRGSAISGNWAGAGNSALLDDFYWMYDDGPGSFNEDCAHRGDAGCWGHRHDILFKFEAPLVMGAAVVYNTRAGTSMAEEFIGGDTVDKADVTPTWRTISTHLPPALAITASRTRLPRHHGVSVAGTLKTNVTHKAVARQLVELQRWHGGGWQDVTVRRTNVHGRVRFTLHPVATATYRLQARGDHGARRGVSGRLRIEVR